MPGCQRVTRTLLGMRTNFGGSMVELPPSRDGLRRWQLFAEAPRGPDGRRRRVSVVHHGSSVKDARAALAEHIAAVRARERIASDPTTLAAWAPRWMAHLDTLGRSPNTLRGYRQQLDRVILPALGNRRLADIRPADIRDLCARLRTDGLAPASVRRIHAIIRRCLADAVLEELIAHNPAERVRPPSIPQSEITPPSPTDVARLIARADELHPQLGLWARLAAGLGARRSEICGLQWRDVDLGTATITIRRTVTVIQGEHLELPTKTRTIRRVPIPDDLLGRLTARWRDVCAWAEQCGTDPSPEWWVLPMGGAPDHERPFPPDSASQAWARIRAGLGLDHVRLHDLRHAYVTGLLAAGLHITDAAELAGHASTITTARVYAHATPAGLDRARTLLANVGNPA